MLKEPCPTCNGVQIKFKGKVYCTNHDDLEDVLSAKEVSYSEVSADLRSIVLVKVKQVMTQLENESNLQTQDELVSLMIKYMELLKTLSEAPQRA